jgi:hypothetical protein
MSSFLTGGKFFERDLSGEKSDEKSDGVAASERPRR